MKMQAIIQIVAESYAEEQFIMNRFPGAWFNPISPGRTAFYIPYPQYQEVKEAINEWENANGKWN